MSKLKVLTVVGTRPEVIRLSRVINNLDKNLDNVLVHTGQNYDYELNQIFFKEMSELNKKLNLEELSMGMSSDYLNAIKNSATYVRIGSNIFGERN